MSKILLTFRETFAGEEAVVRVDEGDPVRLTDLTTKLLTGLAAERPMAVPPGRHRVRVALPKRRLETEVEVEMAADEEVWIEVWLQDGGLSLRLPGPSAGYL